MGIPEGGTAERAEIPEGGDAGRRVELPERADTGRGPIQNQDDRDPLCMP